MSLAKALKALIDNPDDLTTLPQLVARAEEIEKSEFAYQERIQKLQDINKAYLAQIPIPGMEPQAKEPELAEPTLAEASAAIVAALGGGTE